MFGRPQNELDQDYPRDIHSTEFDLRIALHPASPSSPALPGKSTATTFSRAPGTGTRTRPKSTGSGYAGSESSTWQSPTSPSIHDLNRGSAAPEAAAPPPNAFAMSSPGTIGKGFASSKSSEFSFLSREDGRQDLTANRRSYSDYSARSDLAVGGNITSTAVEDHTRGVRPLVGAIGDRRKQMSPSRSPDRPENPARGGSAAAAESATNNSSGERRPLSANSRSSATSRPSSFILDVLPSKTDQARDRALSQSPSFSTADALTSSPIPILPRLNSGPALSQSQSGSGILHSPMSAGNLLLPQSRGSSPAPILPFADSLKSPRDFGFAQGGEGRWENLAQRVTGLESTMSDLANIVQNEMRSLKEEVGVLRGLVLQGVGSAQNPALSRFPSSPLNTVQATWGTSDSPLLTLQSPSPHHSTTFSSSSMPRGSSGKNAYQASNSSRPTHPTQLPFMQVSGDSGGMSPMNNSYQDRSNLESLNDWRGSTSPSGTKDEQIQNLSSHLNTLSRSVAMLMTNAQVNDQLPNSARTMTLPPSSGSSPLPSSMLPTSPSLGGTTGLGVALSGFGGGHASSKSPVLGSSSSNGPPRAGTGGKAQFGSGNGDDRDGNRRRPGASGIGAGNNGMMGFGAIGQSSSNTGTGAFRFDTQAFESMPGSAWEHVPGPNLTPNLNLPPTSSNAPGSLGAKWEALGVNNELFRNVAKYGLGPPTKIQSKAIPCVLRNQDVVAQAPSIQERIQCYVIPAVQLILTTGSQQTSQAEPRGIQALILTATVDQSAQAQRLCTGLGGSLGIRSSLCVGQGDIQQDAQTVKRNAPHILVGTPQRLLDLFNAGLFPLADVKLLIIDECDQLIARNLAEHVNGIVRLLPPSIGTNGGIVTSPASPLMARSPLLPGAFDTPMFANSPRFPSANQSLTGAGAAVTGLTSDRQTAIYSCTVPQDVLNFASSLQLREPVRVLVRREGAGGGGSGENGSGSTPNPNNPTSTTNNRETPTLRGVKLFYLYITQGGQKTKSIGGGRKDNTNPMDLKLDALSDLCEDYAFESCIIFCSNPDTVEAVSFKLGMRAIDAFPVHQDMGQSAYSQAINNFRQPTRKPGGQSRKRCLVLTEALSKVLVGEVNQITLVINYDLPRAVEDFVHRINIATSGFGRSGVAINMVMPGADVDMLRSIESYYRCKIAELPPTIGTSNSKQFNSI